MKFVVGVQVGTDTMQETGEEVPPTWEILSLAAEKTVKMNVTLCQEAEKIVAMTETGPEVARTAETTETGGERTGVKKKTCETHSTASENLDLNTSSTVGTTVETTAVTIAGTTAGITVWSDGLRSTTTSTGVNASSESRGRR